MKYVDLKRGEHIIINGVEHKHCGNCNSFKPADYFYRDCSKADGRTAWCSDCCIEYQRSRRKEMVR